MCDCQCRPRPPISSIITLSCPPPPPALLSHLKPIETSSPPLPSFVRPSIFAFLFFHLDHPPLTFRPVTPLYLGWGWVVMPVGFERGR